MAGEALDLLVVGAVLVENCPVAELLAGEVSFLEGWHLGSVSGRKLSVWFLVSKVTTEGEGTIHWVSVK